ncbi:hypothetical protein GIB67_020085, partial [Kingdonia uniflora]
TEITIVVRTTERLPWNFGPRVQVIRTILNLVRTTLVKTQVSPRSSWITSITRFLPNVASF